MLIELLNYLKTQLADRKKRGYLILVTLLLALLTVVIYRLLLTEQDPPGAMIPVVCAKCYDSSVKRVTDISIHRCDRCGGELGYIRKCGDCGYVFPWTPPNLSGRTWNDKKDRFRFIIESQVCPNCGSLKTGAVPPGLYDQMKPSLEQEKEIKQKKKQSAAMK